MRLNRMLLLSLCAVMALGMIACEEEGPAYDEDAAGEAALAGTDLEEDAQLSDDIPIGEPEVFDNGRTEPAHPTNPANYGEVPPASDAIQETPSLPGGGESAGEVPTTPPVQ